MTDERQLASILAYAEHDQGDIERRLASIIAYVEHDQGDVERRMASIIAYAEYVVPPPALRTLGPAAAFMGG